MSVSTADLSDELEDRARIANPGLRRFGGKSSFSGIISTVKCFEDNSLVRTALQEQSDGRVLVVDGGASMGCALLGDILAGMAADNGWPGIIMNGCIRDSTAIANIDIGVRALDTHPRKSVKLGAGDRDVIVHFAGIDFVPGDYIYVDEDGILVTSQAV